MCDSKELLVGYLYDELDAAGRRAFDAHLTACAECREELAGLRSTRVNLRSWTPPEPDLGFQIVRSPAPPPAGRVLRVSPAWGLAAAAVLVMAVASAVANVEVRYGSDGLIIRTGLNRAARVAAAAAAPAVIENANSQVAADQVDRRLRQLEAAARARPSPMLNVDNASAEITDVEVLRRVREMLGQSETRQQRALGLRITELTREFDAQRRLDLAAIEQGMSRLQSTSGAEVRQYRDMIQRMYRATAYQQK